MTKTDSKDGSFGRGKSRFEMFDCRCECGGIAWTIGDEQTVMRFGVGERCIPREDF
jgi:hypothetical protein